MGRHGLVALALVVVSVALVAAGCGGDDGDEASTTAAWAEDFCTAVSSWTDELEQIGDNLTGTASVEELEDAANEASDATDAFVEEVRDLGAPETQSGDEIESSLETFADSVEAERTEIEEAVDDADGLIGAAGAVAAIGNSLAAMATAFQTTIESFESEDVGGELEAAFEETPACDEISN